MADSPQTLFQQALNSPGSLRTRVIRLERGLQTQRAGKLVTPSGPLSKVSGNLLDDKGNILISNTQITKRGSIPPAGSTSGFAYAATDNSIHLYWDGTNGSKRIVIYRTDGSQSAIPGGDINITGLAADTTYYFLPYWSPLSNTCSIGFVGGTVGSPDILFTVNTDPVAIQSQSLQGLEPLSNGFAMAKTAAGGGTNTGGGIGCVMRGTDIETLGGYDYTVEVMSETNWIRITTQSGKSLTCSDSHVLYLESGKVDASVVAEGDRIITIDGVETVAKVERFCQSCTKHRIRMTKGHLYWANGILSHNMKTWDGTV